MKFDAIVYERAQLGWRCSIVFGLTTARQFTDEVTTAIGRSRWRWLAYIRAKREVRRLVKAEGDVRSKRAALGWAAVAGLLLLALVPSTRADNCAPAVRHYAAPVYHYPAATAYPQVQVLGIFIPAPSYTVGLTVSDPASAERFEKLLQRLDALESRLTAPQALRSSHLTSCAKCHTGADAKGGFVWSDKLSARDKARAAAQIMAGAMPPKAPIPAGERVAAVEELLK